MEPAPYEARKLALIEEITAAFDGVELEDGVSFHEAIVRDDDRIEDRNHPLRVDARAKETETRWQDVPDELLTKQGHSILNFLDPKGFHYYIPAFLVWYLRNMDDEEIDCNTYDSVDYQLQGGVGGRIGDAHRARFSILSRSQSQAVAHFLEFLIARYGKMQVEEEEERRAAVALGEMTEEQAQNDRERSKSSWASNDLAPQALKLYWGQFLESNEN